MAGKSGNDQQHGERIAKAIARAGLASRREAEAWIAAGRVMVNGEKITSPARNITSADRIVVDGKSLPVRERTRLFLFHKRRGLVTTHSDPQGRPTVFDALPKHLPRLISIGRLDANTEGLLLLTNDGGLARTLELPATGWTRRYRVRANGKITQVRLDRLRHGIEIDGVTYGPIEARLDREQGANVWLTFAMREGKNREVKNVLGHLGLAVNRLIRVSFGPFQLGDLPEGEIDEVRTRHLREQVGERVANAAGLDFAGPIEDQSRMASGRRSESRAEARVSLPPRSGGEGRRSEASRGGGPGGSKKFPPTPDPSPPRAARAGGGETAPPRVRLDSRRKRRHGPDRLGEPEKARRERKHGKRPFRGKPR
ncbi:MAG: pseudouridine synthase [Rhizobiales bacterium]|nr:pseudouridine synthase [Hyphomicrobiales bacterium]